MVKSEIGSFRFVVLLSFLDFEIEIWLVCLFVLCTDSWVLELLLCVLGTLLWLIHQTIGPLGLGL